MGLLLLALLLSVAAAAQLPPPFPPPPPSILTVGEATVTAEPDRAILDFGVVTQAPTAQAAAAENANALDTALRQVKAVAGPGAEVKTSGYSLQPDYRFPRQGAPPEIAGYTARNTIEVATSNLAAVGAIIDAATRSGANTVQRLQFTLRDNQAARAIALRDAARKARASAEAIASALGLRITRVLRAEQGAPSEIRPMMYESMGRASVQTTAPTPVESGTIEVHATVTLTVEIGQ